MGMLDTGVSLSFGGDGGGGTGQVVFVGHDGSSARVSIPAGGALTVRSASDTNVQFRQVSANEVEMSVYYV